MKRMVLAGVLVVAAACGRLGDPIYERKPLSAPEPYSPGQSLVFGRIGSAPGLLNPAEIDEVVLRKVAPAGPDVRADEEILYRAFSPRVIRDGYFVLLAPPGLYELGHVAMSRFGASKVTLSFTDESRTQTRVWVTEPGIYDAGTWVIAPPSEYFAPFRVASRKDSDPTQRRAILEEAVRGTSWANGLDRVRTPPD